MKVTGGKSKGRILASIKGRSIRPTSSKVREAVFNLLDRDINGLKVLDLFAGTGILGIEALSRGALCALFVDNSHLALKIINKNLKLCGLENSGIVLKKDIMRGLPLEHPFIDRGIDLVFIDPPYNRKNFIPLTLEKLSQGEILRSSSVVVAESLQDVKLPVRVGKLSLFKTRIYGETKIDIYHREDF